MVDGDELAVSETAPHSSVRRRRAPLLRHVSSVDSAGWPNVVMTADGDHGDARVDGSGERGRRGVADP